ncbi:MAG: glycosyltransferase [Tenuifilaceae bacterium]|nr:glycosyltransferase [Bacteroidales bacterium]MDI9516972.1 glycosyltransferase [Bacteroidota bacterium]NLH57046.1 glycosyltransferase [Rikenellaceae bacterium]OQC61130.1 MAG: Beta-monoglucosyldiacylglycerol synthase [Bacteroidetes bacterium ADurb.Bin008]HNV81521.1 glycosyltransferase [Tenuifilaceae bacterium]
MIVIFWIASLLLFHTYILYPFILWLLTINSKPRSTAFTLEDELPFVSVIMAAHNEEMVIGQKIDSIFKTGYPATKIELLVGSDCSTDGTNAIITQKKEEYGAVTFMEFMQRQGKANIMNQLLDMARGEIIISTDANVMLTPTTIFDMVKYFKDPVIGLVDSRMMNTGIKREGISAQESAYISREVMIKYREGLVWGAMMGPFGGCFAIRKDSYCKVPKNFFMDDFFINMKVIQQGKKTINSLEAVVYEDVSNKLIEEYRRKVRISIGNFQNLTEFYGMLWPPYKGPAFAFLSHKVLRWFGPFFLLMALIASAILSFHSHFYLVLLAVQLFLYLLPLVDFLLRLINIHSLVLRFATHFFSMNIALLHGLIKFLKGVSSNVWQPTQRNQ